MKSQDFPPVLKQIPVPPLHPCPQRATIFSQTCKMFLTNHAPCMATVYVPVPLQNGGWY